jgi:hypothetical protein
MTVLSVPQTTKATSGTASSASLLLVAPSSSLSRPSTAAKKSPIPSCRKRNEIRPPSSHRGPRRRSSRPVAGRLRIARTAQENGEWEGRQAGTRSARYPRSSYSRLPCLERQNSNHQVVKNKDVKPSQKSSCRNNRTVRKADVYDSELLYEQ